MTVGSSLNYGSEEGNQMTHSFYRSAVHVQRHSFVFSLQCSTRITYCSDTRFRITLSPFCIVHEVRYLKKYQSSVRGKDLRNLVLKLNFQVPN